VFDSVKLAPITGYNDSTAFMLTDSTVIVKSSPGNALSCTFSVAYPLYAKLRVIAIDTAARRIDFEILRDINCGYRGLETGLPRH
jgi:hypothetical protein